MKKTRVYVSTFNRWDRGELRVRWLLKDGAFPKSLILDFECSDGNKVELALSGKDISKLKLALDEVQP